MLEAASGGTPKQPQINIVSELARDGTLFDLLLRFGGKGLQEAQAVHILKDISRGLLHMHS
jgi:serine/threonine protein kinase